MRTIFIRTVTVLLTLTYHLSFAQLEWINYNGSIPANAVPGGNEPARNLAVCRGQIGGNSMSGKVVEGKCNVSLGGAEHVLTSFEVLINKGNVELAWIKTGGAKLPDNAVAGGMENGNQTTYVGRLQYMQNGTNLGIHPGKVIKVGSTFTLYFGYAGKEIESREFEVLTVKPKTGNSEGVANNRWVLSANENLELGQQINSPNGQYHLALTRTGDLCIYQNKTRQIWRTGTAGSGAVRLRLTQGGELHLVTSENKVVWSPGNVKGWKCGLDNEGQLVLFNASGNYAWASGTASKVENGTVKDIDGNTYTTVRVGNQHWMAENLRTTKFNNGEAIPVQKFDQTSVQPAMYWYSNDPRHADSQTYGALYNWAVIQKQKVCPVGWHVPGVTEWEQVVEPWIKLPNQKKDGMTAAYHLRKQGNTNWSNNGSATNSTGFSAIPGGWVSNNGAFRNVGVQGAWWLQKNNHGTPYFFKIADQDDGSWISEANVKDILTIRCVQDAAGTTQVAASSQVRANSNSNGGNSSQRGNSNTNNSTENNSATGYGDMSEGLMSNALAEEDVVGRSLQRNQNMMVNQRLRSENGQYDLILQPDGNLCIYKNKTQFVWATMTNGKDCKRLSFQQDGNVCLYNERGGFIWGVNTFIGAGYQSSTKLRLENSGILVLYDASGKTLWTSASANTSTPTQTTSTVALPSRFRLHAYSVGGQRVETGTDYWMGFNPKENTAGKVGRIINPSAGTVMQIEKVNIDAAKGIVALKVINAPQANMYLTVADDKKVTVSQVSGTDNRHHFYVRNAEEKESAALNYVSFESVAFTGWYLRHFSFVLNVTQATPNVRNDKVYRHDASWFFDPIQ